jgi:hypothetical protein
MLALVALSFHSNAPSKIDGQESDIAIQQTMQKNQTDTCHGIMCEIEVFLLEPTGSIILNILGGIISAVIFALIVYLWRKPRLRFVRENKEVSGSDDRRFYQIFVKNYGHSTAFNCKVDIEFINRQSGDCILIKYGKWVENLEPATIGVGLTDYPKVPQPSLLKYTWYMSIPPSTSQAFTLLLKHKGEEYCYAFNGENYIEGFNTDLRVESRKINKGQYVANLTVLGDNVKSSGSYYIYNEGPELTDVTITPY